MFLVSTFQSHNRCVGFADVHFLLIEFVLHCLQFVVVFFEAVHSGGVDVLNQGFAIIISAKIAKKEHVSCHFLKTFLNLRCHEKIRRTKFRKL